MPPKKETVSYTSLSNEIENKKFRPIYVLEGEEAYYIDNLTEKIIENALEEDEKDFNLTVCYGIDANIREVISTCKRYPVMAERQVVVLKEAQNVGSSKENNLDLLKYYAQNPLRSTVLVICYKGGMMKAPEFMKELKSSGTGAVFDSPKVNDSSIISAITGYVESKGCKIDEKSKMMLRDFVGTDVARMFGEIDKLCILVDDTHKITPELIEKNIGISKDYNNFELEDAMMTRNAEKAFKIIHYYQNNPKNNPVVLITTSLFGLFSNLLLVRTAPNKSVDAICERIGTKSQWRAQKFMKAAANYSTRACVDNISAIRRFDAQTKGIGSRQDGYELLKDLMFNMLNAR